MNNQVIIFDTTLRDGEQALSASLTVKEKLQIAYALERLGVDIIEAGFLFPLRAILNRYKPSLKTSKIAVFVPFREPLRKTLMPRQKP